MIRRYFFVDCISALLIILFVYTGLSKLTNHVGFVLALNKSSLLKENSALLSWLVPWLEISIAAFLAFPKTRLLGLYGSAILMAIFTFYVAFILTGSKSLPCTCGGVIQIMTWKDHLYFNTTFLILSLIGCKLQNKINLTLSESHANPGLG